MNTHEFIQTRDIAGESGEYATLFAWASFIKQSKHMEAIRRLIAIRCIQEKVTRRKYEKDFLPLYLVPVCVRVCLVLSEGV